MPAISLQLPSDGDVVEAALHENNYASIQAVINGGLATDNLATNASIVDTQLASSQNGVYHTLQASGAFNQALGNGTYYLTEAGDTGESGTNGQKVVRAIYLQDTDYAVAGKTSRLRVSAQFFTNGTPPANTHTFGFYPIDSTGGSANNINITLGTVITGSTVAFASPAQNLRSQGNSGDFSFPASGYYALGFIITGGAPSANAAVSFSVQVQLRWT